MRLLILSLGLLFLFGCAHSATHGTVAMKISDEIAHVSVHGLNVGQKVTLFHNNCTTDGRGERGGAGRSCKRERVTTGTVSEVLNEHYSVVTFPPGTKFAEGDFVETE